MMKSLNHQKPTIGARFGKSYYSDFVKIEDEITKQIEGVRKCLTIEGTVQRGATPIIFMDTLVDYCQEERT